MGFRKKKLDSMALYNSGLIILRPEQLYRFVQLYVFSDVDHDLLVKRIKACLPQNVDISTLIASSEEVFFSAQSWDAKLVFMGSKNRQQAFEFWFTDPKSSSDLQALLLMNVLQTAVEKAILLSDAQAQVESARATSTARFFEIGSGGKDDKTLFKLFELHDISPSSIVIRALEVGASTISSLYDGAQTQLFNESIRNSGAMRGLLLTHYENTPAMPHSLRSKVAYLSALSPKTPLYPSKAPHAQVSATIPQREQACTAVEANCQTQISTCPNNIQAPTSPTMTNQGRANPFGIINNTHQTAFCQYCGAPTVVHARFCSRCGAVL